MYPVDEYLRFESKTQQTSEINIAMTGGLNYLNIQLYNSDKNKL